MNYVHYSVEDFVLDKKFRDWILRPDRSTTLFWEDWLAQHPDKQPLVHQARHLVLELPEVRYVYGQEKENQLWERITDAVHQPSPGGKVVPLNRHPGSSHRMSQPRHWVMKGWAAASVLVLLSLVGAYLWLRRETRPSFPEIQQVVKENPNGQRSTIYLSDGTEVVLSAGSRLTYEEPFSSHERAVSLRGEAFFQVAKDVSRPFRVASGEVATQALGTSFNVKAFPEQGVQVSLVTGKVKVSLPTSMRALEMILSPGEGAIYHPATPGQLYKQPFDQASVLAWKNGTLYFEDATVEEVFSTLERWYGVEITFAQPISNNAWSFTGQFHNESLENVLTGIGYIKDFNYHLDGKSVLIAPSTQPDSP